MIVGFEWFVDQIIPCHMILKKIPIFSCWGLKDQKHVQVEQPFVLLESHKIVGCDWQDKCVVQWLNDYLKGQSQIWENDS